MLGAFADHRQPWLLCVDLQGEHVTPGRPLFAPRAQAAVEVCGRVLAHARRCGWTVIHAHRRRPGGLFAEGRMSAAIEGLWPLASERVFRREGLSAFSNTALAELAQRASPPEIYLVGLSLHQAGLATALGAADLGLDLVVVSDAAAAAPAGAWSADEMAAFARAVLEPHVTFTTSCSLPSAMTSGLQARGGI